MKILKLLASVISEPPKLPGITAGSVLCSYIIWDALLAFDVWDDGITYLMEGSCIETMRLGHVKGYLY